MVVGAQMFTLREFCQNERDLDYSLKSVAEMGYRTVQISGIGPIPPERVRALCDAHGLTIAITHYNQDRILNDTEAVIREHDILGCRYIGLGSMPSRYQTAAWFDHFAWDYKEPARKIKAAGKLLMYHNHAFELEKFDGLTLLDRLAADFLPDELGFTLDTYWIQTGGGDLLQWIEKLRGRLPCVHLKDMAVVGGQTVMAPLGEGNLNLPAIVAACLQGGTEHFLVEQDTCRESPFVCLEKSYQYLTSLSIPQP